jgi:hypothetical protein
MKKNRILISVALLVVSIGSYLSIMSGKSSIRAVEFLFIWAIGAISGVLLTQIINTIKAKKK